MEYKRVADNKRLEFIIRELKLRLPEGAEVLDVGCGNGVISRKLGKEGFRVRGIDVSEKAIEKARQLNESPAVQFEVMSAEALNARGSRYHAIICSEVLEHLNEPGKLVTVLRSLLEPDGVLIVTVPNGRGPRELFVTRPVIRLQRNNGFLWKAVSWIKGKLGYRGTTVQSDADDLTHIQFFSKPDLEMLARRNGFTIIRFGKTNFVEDVFPFSLLTKRFSVLQELDCAVAERLPYGFTGGFMTVWKKSAE